MSSEVLEKIIADADDQTRRTAVHLGDIHQTHLSHYWWEGDDER